LKKIIIAGAILATGASAYIVTKQATSPSHQVLQYIPQDTPVFIGQLTPFPLKDYLKSAQVPVQSSSLQDMKQLSESTQPLTHFLLSLMHTYQTSLADADLFINTFGLADEVRAYFYTLGLLPVFKIEVANEQAIWDLLDKAELESGFTHTKGTLESINYRAYLISDKSESVNAELIVAIDKGLLTITLNSAYHTKTLLSQALGLTKAKQSLADSGVVEALIKKYDFKEASLAFINHIELIKGLTTQDGNQLATQLALFEKNLASGNALSQLRDPQCATELSSIANHWPRTVSGYTQLDITAQQSTVAMSSVIESNNNTILTALSDIRGFVPQYVNDFNKSVFAMGFGFDVSYLASTFNTVWSDLQTPHYTCQPLAQIQTHIKASGQSIAILGMGANMVNGLQGIAMSLLDYNFSTVNEAPRLDDVDALLTLSAENPVQLFNSAKMFVPDLQHITLSKDGPAVNLNEIIPIPTTLNISPKLAIKGNHIVIYNGEKAAQVASQLSTEALTKNSIYNLSFDFKKMIDPIMTAATLSGEAIPEEIMLFKEYDGRMKMSFDVNQQGILLKSVVNSRASQ